MMYTLIRKLLFTLDAECSHELSLKLLSYYGRFAKVKPYAGNAVMLMGLTFPNRVGLAAGLDKQATCIDGLASLGFGFLEIGTVTPKPQAGNPKPRLFRLPQVQALINRFGFNSVGVERFIENFQRQRYQGIVGINLGKNMTTPVESAVEDYLFGLRAVYPHASYVTINISSPNTKNLRDLQQFEMLDDLLSQLKQAQQQLSQTHQRYVPLVVKIAPDLETEQIKRLANTLLRHDIDGVIATNTSSMRPKIEQLPMARESGGLSGAPITAMSTEVVYQLARQLQQQIPIIAVGGIMSLSDAQAKLDAGAQLVQVYTGLIYQGPALIKQLTREL